MTNTPNQVYPDTKCPVCDGTGKIWNNEHTYLMHEPRNFTCPTCSGTGHMSIEPQTVSDTEPSKVARNDQVDAVDEILVLFSKRLAIVQGERNAGLKLSSVQLHAEEAVAEAKAKLSVLLVDAQKQIASDIRDASSVNLGTDGEVTDSSYVFTEEQRDLINDFIKELEKQREETE